MDPDLLKHLQRHLANITISPPAVRGMGPAGTAPLARDYLEGIGLDRFSVGTGAGFARSLNDTTATFVTALPRGARHWGSARKYLNVFLRNCVYNRHVCRAYALGGIERWLELPLDSHAAAGLAAEPEGAGLPPWDAIIRLTPERSRDFQEVATRVARRKRIWRVHLDLIYWRAKD